MYMQSLQGMLPRITTRRTNMNNMNSLFTWRFPVVIHVGGEITGCGGSKAKAGQVHTISFSSKLVAMDMDDIHVETVIQHAANVNTPGYGERDIENTRRLRHLQLTDEK
jgi:hypothetical protein